jgi:hypothetical protein
MLTRIARRIEFFGRTSEIIVGLAAPLAWSARTRVHSIWDSNDVGRFALWASI